MNWLPVVPLTVSFLRGCSKMAVQPGSKDLLLKLRRKTNYSYLNCRRALEKFDYNFEQAEKWLTETALREGWQKAAKLAGRSASQGLIGINLKDAGGALVEVNCETDFVARTSGFRQLVSAIASACRAAIVGNQRALGKSLCKRIQVPVSELSRTVVEHDGKSSPLDDLIALSMSTFGEKVCLRRCTCLLTSDDIFLSGYVHPKPSSANDPLVGQYGALVAFKSSGDDAEGLDYVDVGQKLCQHVVGMNPKSIGLSSEDSDDSTAPPTQKAEVDRSSESTEEVDDEALYSRTELNSATELLRQTFLLDPNQTVGQFLKAKRCDVYDFARFSLDEEVEDNGK
uniref:Elongation factor Ts, mitochondrial n=1 Tax=Trichuris muris TaxID=70415 RepID=A0A5S6R4U2_TRIMR